MKKHRKQKKNLSISVKAFRAIIAGALLLIFLISLIVLGMEYFSAMKSHKREARHLMNYSMHILDSEYVEKIFRETKEVYASIPDDVKADPFSDEYMDYFWPLVDDDFFAARNVLVECRSNSENRNVFLMFTDPELNAIVYVVDGDEDDWAYLPGQWIEGDLQDIERIEKSPNRMRLTYTSSYGWIGTDYEKIYDAEGNQLGYIVMDVDMNDFSARILKGALTLIPAAVIIILLVAALAARLLRTQILTYVTSLAATAKDYTARDKVEQLEDTSSYFEPLDIETGDELEDLWKSMVDMETDVKETMRRLKTMTAEQERMEAELSIAKQIQEGTLPHEFPAFPNNKEFDIYASMTPAREVGGDFYDFFMIDDDHLGMVIADVSGKGITAALFMVNSKGMIQNQTMTSGENVAEVIEKVNARLMEQNEAMMFVTVWLAVLTLSTGHMVYCNAGHEYPAICRKGGQFSFEKDVHSGAVAIHEMMKFRSGEFDLKPGDTIFCCTDGVLEANDIDEELFGKERTLAALNRDPDADPQTLEKNVRQGIADFVGDAEQFDDITILCLKYFGPQGDTPTA